MSRKSRHPVMKPWACEVRDGSGEHIDHCEQQFEDIAQKALWPLASFECLPGGGQVENDSRLWTSRFLTDAANPHQPGQKIRRRFRPADVNLPDVLRHELSISYDDVALDLQVTETISWLRVDIRQRNLDLRTLSRAQCASAIAWIAERILRLQGTHKGRTHRDTPHTWTFLHGPLVPGARFSTAPSVDQFTMWSWSDRIDGGIDADHVYFLGFKHREPINGHMVVLDDRHWFDGRCWMDNE